MISESLGTVRPTSAIVTKTKWTDDDWHKAETKIGKMRSPIKSAVSRA